MFLKMILALSVTAFAGMAGTAAGEPSEGLRADQTKVVMKAEAEVPEAPAQVGKPAPDFTLTSLSGDTVTLSDYVKAGNIVVLEWFNPDCPFVKKHHVTYNSMLSTQEAFAKKNVVWLAINSGAPGNQGAGLERNLKAAKDYSITYPVLLDETGDVGRLYGAKTTPQMFVIQNGILVFDGPLDNKPSFKEMGDKNYVREVLEKCCAGKTIDPEKVKSYGCSVKYAS